MTVFWRCPHNVETLYLLGLHSCSMDERVNAKIGISIDMHTVAVLCCSAAAPHQIDLAKI